MSWSSLNYYRLDGTITSGITLDVNNPKTGTAPSGYLTYDDVNYDSTTYAFGAYFFGQYASSITNNRVTIPVTGIASHFTARYAGSPTGTVFNSWVTFPISSGDNNVNIDYKYFRIEIKIDNNLWSDADGFYVSTVLPYYKVFQKYTIISSDEMNGNFSYIANGDLIPHGGINLDPTTSIYDLGSDIYKWKTIYAENVTASSVTVDGDTFIKISETIITSSAISIEFSGLNGDVDNIYVLAGQLTFAGYSTTTGIVNMIINGDSSAAYGGTEAIFDGVDAYNNDNGTGKTSVVITRQKNVADFNFTMFAKTGIARHGFGKGTSADASSAVHYMNAFFWSSTSDTITSIKLYTSVDAMTITSGKISLYALR